MYIGEYQPVKLSRLFLAALTTLVAVITLALFISPAPAVLALTPQQEVCSGISDTGTSCGGGVSVDSAIATGLNILSWIVGIAAIVMIIIGGFKYITSSGDPANVKSAKDTILYAIIGMVIVAMAQFIVKFVLNKTIVPPPPTPTTSQHP